MEGIDEMEMPLDVTEYVLGFRNYLNTAWPHLGALLVRHDWENDPNFLVDWVRVNWEFLIGEELLGSFGQLLSLDPRIPRVRWPNKTTTHKVVCQVRKRSAVIPIGDTREAYAGGELLIYGFGTSEGKNFRIAAPFDCVQLCSPNIQKAYMAPLDACTYHLDTYDPSLYPSRPTKKEEFTGESPRKTHFVVDQETLPYNVTSHVIAFRDCMNEVTDCIYELAKHHDWHDFLTPLSAWLVINWDFLVGRELLGLQRHLMHCSIYGRNMFLKQNTHKITCKYYKQDYPHKWPPHLEKELLVGSFSAERTIGPPFDRIGLYTPPDLGKSYARAEYVVLVNDCYFYLESC